MQMFLDKMYLVGCELNRLSETIIPSMTIY